MGARTATPDPAPLSSKDIVPSEATNKSSFSQSNMLQVCLITTKYSFLSQVKQNCKDGDQPGFHYPLPCLPQVPRAGCGTPTIPASTEDSPGHQEMEEKGQARGTGMQSEAQATHACREQRMAFSQGGTEASRGGKKLGTGPLAEKGHGKMKRLRAPPPPV